MKIRMNQNRKKYQQQNNELPELLIYRKKKYIIPGALLLFFALLLLSFVITLGIVSSVGEDMAEVASEMLEPQNLIYLIAYNLGYLLPGLAILGVPALLLYAVLHIGERRFLRIYQGMPEPAKQKLSKMKSRNLFLRGLGFYEADGYILFNDRCFFGTPQIARIDDIVWGYLGRSDIQYSNVEMNVMSPSLQFFSLCFYTKDGRRHRIFASMSYKEVVSWFTAHCPRAILGYGKEQKRQAEEIFRREAEQSAFLRGEEKDSYLRRKERLGWAIICGCVLAVLVLAAGFYIRQYSKSDTYLYRENMKEADKYFAGEEWSRAYRSYYAARDYRPDDEDATKGMLLSCLGMAKKDGYLDSIIRDYENLFYHQDLFTDEMDISEWYFDCAGYYLRYDDPMGAVDLLERGMETFSRKETVAESRENILRKMQRKTEDILAHCKIESVTKYIYGERREYTQYDEEGQEILKVPYFNRSSTWFYKSYDKDGNMILEETYKKKDGEEEKQKTREEYFEYDDMGNLLHEERYDLVWGSKVHESVSRYDEEGNRIYYKVFYEDGILYEVESCVKSDAMQIEREYNADYPERDQYCYIEQKWDEEGNLLEKAYYPASCLLEEIQSGEAVSQVRYRYTYDERGNSTASHILYERTGESEPVYEREYDDRDNLVKEIYYYKGDSFEDSYVETTVWYYNEENLLVKKEKSTGDDEEIWRDDTENYTYDETGNLIRTDYIRTDRINRDTTVCSVIKEYDLLGNQIKEYMIDGGAQIVPEDLTPDGEWEYKYHYSKDALRWER